MKVLWIIPILAIAVCGCVSVNNPNTNQTKGQETTSNYELAAKVKVAIASDPSISASSRMVSVTADDGVITLSGKAATQTDANRIINIAQNVEGVKSVNNQMTVSGY